MKNISKIKKGAGLPCASITTRGFTIIELLVVIAIIALLTGIVMTSLVGSRAKARDAKRISDMGQIQLALELYYDRCKEYPAGSSGQLVLTNNNGCEGTPITLGSFLPSIPTPPLPSPNSATYYEYQPIDLLNSDDKKDVYYLKVILETYNPALQDDIDEAPASWPGGYDLTTTCSDTDGPADNQYCLASN